MKTKSGSKLVRSHFEWTLFRQAFDVAVKVFQLSKRFPPEEKYSLTDQVRRSSRSVSANIAEAWRRRRYKGAFLMRLNDAEAEAAETQIWLAHAVHCDYVKREEVSEVIRNYESIMGALVNLSRHPEPWLLPKHSDASQDAETKTQRSPPQNPKTSPSQEP
jgi:four helix bundle protein